MGSVAMLVCPGRLGFSVIRQIAGGLYCMVINLTFLLGGDQC